MSKVVSLDRFKSETLSSVDELLQLAGEMKLASVLVVGETEDGKIWRAANQGLDVPTMLGFLIILMTHIQRDHIVSDLEHR